MRILLHACCGPCALMPTQHLQKNGHEVTLFFANPNIHPLHEYLLRREALQQAAEHLHAEVMFQDDVYDVQRWLKDVYRQNLAENHEQGRCRYCYASRLQLTAEAAAEHGFTAFSTTLLYSRYQNHEMIQTEAKHAADTAKTVFFYQDFRPFWQEGIDLSRTWGLYRQQYCACIFSESERYAKKLQRCKARHA